MYTYDSFYIRKLNYIVVLLSAVDAKRDVICEDPLKH
jgi:hypothetical protein